MFLVQSRPDLAPRRSATRPMSVESLEGRLVLSTLIVSNVGDSGAGSLRQAIITANAAPAGTTSTIDFAIGKSGIVETIALKSALPQITKPIVVAGTTEPGYAGVPLVVVSGTGAGSGVPGFAFEAAAAGSTLEGVAVVGFSGTGVLVQNTSGVTISYDDIGTANGTSATGNGDGLVVTGGLKDSILDDTISGNVGDGVDLASTIDDVIQGDKIGTNAVGNAQLGNGGDGLSLIGASSNTISGVTASENKLDGIFVQSGSNANVIQGSFLGTDSTGKIILGNVASGISINDSANNLVGGTTAAALNVVSGNLLNGVIVENSASGNVVEMNDIGIGANGLAMGNGEIGVLIDDSAGNFIGEPGAGNTISASGYQGVRIEGSTATKNVVAANLIGTTVTGTVALGNGTIAAEHSGVILYEGASGNTIGGTIATDRNVISGNGYDGVHISTGCNTNTVDGNSIVGNGQVGVEVDSGDTGNLIGVVGAGNTISTNLASGVWLDDVGVGNAVGYDTIAGNGKGTSLAIADMGVDGVRFTGSPQNTLVVDCTIESNIGYGIYFESGGSVVTSTDVIPATGTLINKKGTIYG